MTEEEITVRVQHMFPNCSKYKKCCTTDEKFWAKLDAKVKDTKPQKQTFRPLDAFNAPVRYVWDGK